MRSAALRHRSSDRAAPLSAAFVLAGARALIEWPIHRERPEYFLLGARVGYQAALSDNFSFEVFTGIDNALDKRYSLGNDLNAVGGRYYNAAAPRNFYVGVKLTPSFKSKN